MKFWKIFRFEFNYQLHHVSTWLLFAVFFLFGFTILRMVTLAGDTHLNAPGTIAFFSVFGSAIWIILGGVVTGEAATRDMQTLMYPLTYTTPLSKISYLGARLLAALLLNVLMMLLLFAGFLFSFYGPGAKAQLLGSFRIASYLTSFCFIILPTVIATTSIQFAFAVWSGRAIASYIASIVIIIFSQFGGTTVQYILEWKVLGSLMDLLGTSITAEMEGWTPIELNTRLILLEGTWLWNRVTWLGIAVAALTFTYFRFRFSHAKPNAWRLSFIRFWSKKSRSASPALLNLSSSADRQKELIHVSGFRREFGTVTYVMQCFTIAFSSFISIIRSRGGLTIVAVLAIGTGLFAPEYMQWLGVPLFARTEQVLRILTPPLSSYQTQWIIIPLLTIFYAGELVWHEREARLNELTDTTPVPEWVMMLGKFLGLAMVITAWVAFMMMAGLINQLVMHYHHFEITLYIKALFGIQLTNYLLFAILVFTIHVLLNQKYIGHMVAFGCYGFILFAPMLGIEHNLLIYASDPGWSYSDMRGFEPFITPWLYFKLYWASWAFLLAALATLFWVRSKESGLAERLYLAKHRFTRQKSAFLIALSLVAISGIFIFYNTNVLNRYSNRTDRMQTRAGYEQQYGKYENIPQPALARTNLHVEIYPEKQAADIQATYNLVNRSMVSINSIHLSPVPQVRITGVSFDRKAAATVVDKNLGYHIYSLENKLEPGDSVQMSFKVHIENHSFSNTGMDGSVASNGSHITSGDWMPVIGYDQNRRLRDMRDRKKYGLAPRAERPSLYDIPASYDARHAVQMNFKAVVGTSKNQIAIAPGALQRTWTRGDRRYFQYVANAPILNEYAFFSARYAVREAVWDGQLQPVTIQIYYHPAHQANVERILKSAQASLQYYSQEFGPYPYSHLRVMERPGPGRGMHAAPMTTDYQEGYSSMNPTPNGLDLPYHIMAHEVAHQWWGLKLTPAAIEGSGLLVESLATYSAMQVVEQTLGYEHLLRYLSQMRLEYEVPRSRAAPPLLRTNNAFMNYRKGPFALFAMRNYIGKDRVNNALRQLLISYTGNPPLPTTLDFYKQLLAVTPDSLQYLAHDLFEANIFWELQTKQATSKQTSAGNWQVSLDVEARKVTVDSMGVETNLPMNDWIEIGVYGSHTKSSLAKKVLYQQKHRVGSGKRTIVINVPEKPLSAGIDPNHLLVDLNFENNMQGVVIKKIVGD